MKRDNNRPSPKEPFLPCPVFIIEKIVTKLKDILYIFKAPLKKSKKEKHLCRTLLDLRRKTKEIGLEKWMNKLADFTSNCV